MKGNGSTEQAPTTLCMSSERIEILPVELLDIHRPLVDSFHQLSRELGFDRFGWHYLLDLCWIAAQVEDCRGKTIVDAGAGTGILQWWLAEQGATVISVDRLSRADLPFLFRQRYRVEGLRPGDLQPWSARLRRFLPPRSPRRWKEYPSRLRDAWSLLRIRCEPMPGSGAVWIYTTDLTNLSALEDESVDAVVALSALEHNDPGHLPAVVKELMRVLAPGGKLAATLGAAKDHDWYHEPSQGWCYTASTLRRLFGLPPTCPDNYERYDELFQSLYNCAELRDNLAQFYFESDTNGMPCGIWNPKYQPVGVVKKKWP